MEAVFYIGFFMVNLFLGMLLMTTVDVYCKKNNYDFGESQMMWVLMYAIGITLLYYGILK